MALSAQLVHQQLIESAKKLRFSRSVRFVMIGAAVSLAFLVACLLLDAWFHFGSVGRWLGFLLIVAPALGTITWSVLAWRAPISESSVARRIEQACPNSGNVLINAVQFDKELPHNSPWRRAIFEDMTNPFPRVEWGRVFDARLLQKLGAAFGAAALAAIVWAMISPQHFFNSAARIFLPASNIAPLTRTRIIEVKTSAATIIRGSEFSITATLGGEVPRNAWVYFRELGSDWQKIVMNREVGQPLFNYRWKEVRQPLELFITAGDTRSTTYRVNVRPRTAIQTKTAEVQPPAYTKLGKQNITDFSVLQNLLPGSTVTATIEFNFPLEDLKATDEQNKPLTVQAADKTHWKITDKITGNRAWKLAYKDTDGLADTDAIQLAVKNDEAPKVTIVTPTEGKELLTTREATVEVEFNCKNAFGLSVVALYRSTPEAQDAQLVQEFKDAASLSNFTGSTKIPLSKFTGVDEERATFVVVAKDQNDVNGPAITFSRPIVVTLRSTEKMKQEVEKALEQAQKNLDELIRMQKTNLDDSRGAARGKPIVLETVSPVLNRQVEIGDLGRKLMGLMEALSPKVRDDLRSLSENEMKEAVLALRTAANAPEDTRAPHLDRAIKLEVAILAKLQGAPESVKSDAEAGKTADLLAGLEDLLRKQRDLHRSTVSAAPTETKQLANTQDALADQSLKVRDTMKASAANAPLGDEQFAQRLRKVADMFTELKVHEDMLVAAEKLSASKPPEAATTQQQVITNLMKMMELLNAQRLADAEKKIDDLKAALGDMRDRLKKLTQVQKEILEKSKEQAKKNEFRPEDIAEAQEIKQSKDLMVKAVEQMLKDMHAFPEMTPADELKGHLMSVYEDVIQSDKEEAEEGKLKPSEIAVQKEDGLLAAIEKADKVAEDMEMWLPDKQSTQKWLLENFDTHEMPKIPNLPLPDTFKDIVGELLKEQEGLKEQVEDAASNQALAQMQQGWDIADGPQPGFAAQGKSGNTPPKHNEQMGRSSGGREGMSNGEMAGDTAQHLEGDKAEVRRTKDPMQKGMVNDPDGPSEARATGGGKAGAFSDREGMEGNGPLRPSNAPRQNVNNAESVAQAMLKQKTAKSYAQANILHLRADELPEVVRMMGDAEQAIKDGRLRDYSGLHQKIVAQLKEIKGRVASADVVALPKADAPRAAEKQTLGGTEGEVPPQYKDMVADYYKALTEDRR